MAKEKIRVVVELHGGTVQSVQTDSDVELDVVFTESSKYAEGDDGETKVNKADIDPVFKAAEKRLEASK